MKRSQKARYAFMDQSGVRRRHALKARIKQQEILTVMPSLPLVSTCILFSISGTFQILVFADNCPFLYNSAHYWQKRYGGKVPQPSSASNVEPMFLDEYTWESDDFYGKTCITTPLDFNCDCSEDGCSEDSFPCCADNSCACDCDEDGCSAVSPSCCASGTCRY
jgi:hypothetical protein